MKNIQTDEEAEAEAAEARREGTEMIANHLSMHLSQNPDSSYVTWIATLHPENADVTIDQRFLVPQNPWWTVYEGAKNDIPIANAVPLHEDQADPNEDIPTPTYVPTKTPSTSTNEPSSSDEEPKTSSPCNPIDSLVGCCLSLSATLTVVALETVAFLIYGVAAGVWNLAKSMEPPNIFTGLLYCIFMLVYWALAIVDSSLLLASVLTVEIVAGACYILSLLFGGCDKAASWHQYIRRTCHMMRWAFRSRYVTPSRHFYGCCRPKEELNEDEVVDVEDQIQRHVEKSTGITPTFVVFDEKDFVVDEHGKGGI